MNFILHIDQYLAQLISQYQSLSYLVLFAFIFTETGFVIMPFIPGDSLLFAAGALVAAGHTGLNIYLLAAFLIIAAFAGNTVNYWIGHYTGPKVFKEGNKILKPEYYVRTQSFFKKHGSTAMILSRFVPIIRTIAPFVAGVGRMSFKQYSIYNLAGGMAWVIVLLASGYFLGSIPVIRNNFSLVVVVIVLISTLPAAYAALRGNKK